VKIKVRERIAKVQKTPRRKIRRRGVENYRKTAQRDKYQKALDLKLKQKMEGEEEVDSAQKRWEHLEQAIKAGAEEIIWESKYKRMKNGSMKSVQHILERRIKLDRRCYK
jgi:phosphosulfolactate synthase (CoM biosynthesis protein A)